MHGRWKGGEIRNNRIRHMWSSVPLTTTTTAVGGSGDSNGGGAGDSSPASSFFKDIRKISIGDCALFKPPQDAPPFIGIIRSLGSDKENNLQLGVNWLYRPAEVKLLKGVALEAAPNEVFYSFRRDEIPAASLLHPCKVAFLPKGVELPSGISSFVCRRVYDSTDKRLWWLTDHDYTNDQQEEVDQLLHKTQNEMHATVQQQGGRSPKPVNSPMSTSQLKHSPDSVQNSATTFPSHVKGKKRERSDQNSEPVKRERSSKADDGDSGLPRSESVLRCEITKITEKGGLIDSEAVERLVQLMQPDKSERRIDLNCRSLLAGVIAATDKVDCLNRFVQLRGLPVLDEWLQEVHKGKVGDSSSPRDHDRSVEDFLLVLLRALDRLPVNLNALQMCNIGKSVNHLRSHRNSEIQKKARTLVDTWKKRVEAEMNINDAKSGSGQAVHWPARTRHEVSHGGNRHNSVSSDAAMKSSFAQLSSSKSASVKLVHPEAVAKSGSASVPPGNVKLASSPASTSANLRDAQPRTSVIGSGSEIPQSAARDEKSSSSSQSHTNSQCSSDQAKNAGPSTKEDARSSNSGSTSLNKSSGGASRHRKSVNGLQGLAASAVQRDGGSSRNSPLTRISASEKLSQPSTACEKTVDTPASDNNNHKLIVKISNRGRSPAQSVNGGCLDDPSSTNSRASSPVPEKHGQSDRSLKEKYDGYRSNCMADVKTESWQSNDLKDGVNGCDDGDGSPGAGPDCGRCQTSDVTGKLTDVMRVIPSSKSEMKPRKSHDSSLSSINALIESCVKYSEGNAAMSVGDDVGMNLLASVAAGEISKSGVGSPAHSPQRSISGADETCRDYNGRANPHGHGDVSVQGQNQLNDVADVEAQKQNMTRGVSEDHNGDHGDHGKVPGKDLLQNADACVRSDGKPDESGNAASVSPSPACTSGGEGAEQDHECKNAVKEDSHGCAPDRKQGNASCFATEDKVNDVSMKEENKVRPARTESCPSSDAVDDKKDVKDAPKSVLAEQLLAAVMSSDTTARNEKSAAPSSLVDDVLPGQLHGLKIDHINVGGKLVNQGSNPKVEQEEDASPAPQKQEAVRVESSVSDQKVQAIEVDLGNKEAAAESMPQISTPTAHDKGSKLAGGECEETEERASAADASSPAAESSGVDGKLAFDLNEGFDVDDSKDADPPDTPAPGCISSAHVVSPLPSLSVAGTSVSVPASITVASAAKGAFVPPEDLLRNKGELGWKGSAATSAFRPAEPRKVSEVSSGFNNPPAPDVSSGKQGRVRFEIDLNVADDRSLEDMGCHSSEPRADRREDSANGSMRFSGGLDLDLNKVDEAPEVGPPASNSHHHHRFELPLQPAKLSSSSVLSNGEGARRDFDFDLNNGPAAEEATLESSSSYNLHGRATIPVNPPVGFRINSAEIGNLNSWYPGGSTFSAIPIPAPMSDRGEQPPFPIVGSGGGAPPRILGGPTGNMPFNPEMYRGSVLSSSPAVPFPTGPFQYPVFPFGNSFPLPSSSLPGGSTAFMDLSSGGRLCIPAVPSQLVGNPSVSSQYHHRPYVVSLSDVSNSVAVENSRKWVRQGLDLNAGPGGPDLEGRDETLPIPPRPMSTMGSLALADEQSRMYPAGSVMKRKEPEGGWDSDRLSYKQQPSWQ